MTTATTSATRPSEGLTVWSKPNCQQCDATKRFLDKRQIEFEAKNLLEHPEQVAQFQEMNLLQAPIVVTPDDIWSGFRPDRLDDAIARLGLEVA